MEEEIIKKGISIFKKSKDQIGLGDDAGAFLIKDEWLVLTNDMFVESTDFVQIMKAEDVGFKVVTMNVSDISAMGAKPRFFSFSAGFRKGTDISFIEKVFEGISEALNYYGMEVLSADTNEAKELVIDGIAIGFAKNLLLRRNAKPNQLVCVTGEFGRPLSALKIILENFEIDERIAKKLFEKIVRPYARFKEGFELSKIASCSIDVSDGLSKELRTISEMSGVGLIIHGDRIPISNEVKMFCRKNGFDPLDIALNSGEEFELLFTVDKDRVEKLKFDFSIIGKVVEEKGVWLKKDGKLIEIEDRGWRHDI